MPDFETWHPENEWFKLKHFLVATTRDAIAMMEEKAYNPNQETLDKLMKLELEASINVKILKGSETDVIKDFASPDKGGTLDDSSKSKVEQNNLNGFSWVEL